MALTVEDGSCVAAANAFVTRAEFLAWAADYRPDLDVSDTVAVDAAIIRSSSWVSTFPEYGGTRTCGRNQGLSWPRQGVTDCDGTTVPNDEVPNEVKMATYSAAVGELATPGLLTPTITPGTQVKRVKVDVIEQEFMTPQDQGVVDESPLDALRPMVAQVQDYLKCLATFPNDSEETPWPFVT
jgi:hypothetical protein